VDIIFEEERTIGTWVQKQYHPEHAYYSHIRPEYIAVEETTVVAHVVAHWDAGTGVLYVNPSCADENTYEVRDLSAWAPENAPLLTLTANQATAQRRAIAFADAWFAKVAAAIPPEPIDEEVKQAWLAEQAVAQESVV
jgi:hypothetical protein